MQHRAILGWIFAAAFCASVSCGGGGDAIPGFGLPCGSISDCAAYSLKCGPKDTCVQCVDNAACKDDQVCNSGLCKTLQKCEDDQDCKTGVCDEDINLCVPCLLSSDCPSETQGCFDKECVERKECVASSECVKDGLVCDNKAGVCVTCRSTNDCGVRQVCQDRDCVPEPEDPGAGGEGGVDSGGSGGTSGSGGKGGTGGRGGTGGAGGKGGAGGTSGGGMSGGGTGGTGPCGCLNTEVCTPDLRCVSPKLIDDLEDCDSQILPIAGRMGSWFHDADIGITQSYGYNDPSVGAPMIAWTDTTCAAWTTGTPMGNLDQTFEHIGFSLNSGMAYDLSGNIGLQIWIEASSGVQVVLMATSGGPFKATLGAIPGMSNKRSIPFASMLPIPSSAQLATVYEVQFAAVDPKSSFDMAIHRVELY